MSAIKTSLAALQVGSTFATKIPYIAPVAGLLLQALAMRDASPSYNPTYYDTLILLPGSKTVQGRVQNSDAQGRQNRKRRCPCRQVLRDV